MSDRNRLGQRPPSEALIQNTWPRPGISANSAAGLGLVGTFVSDADFWRFEPVQSVPPSEGTGEPLEALKSLLEDLKPGSPKAGAIGYVSYEWGARTLGVTGPVPTGIDWLLPEVQFLVFEQLKHPSASQVVPLATATRSYSHSALDALVARSGITSHVSKSRYLSDVATIKEHIAAGDIYQANYTQALELAITVAAEDTSEALRAILPAPYSAMLKFDACSLSTSGSSPRTFPEITIFSVSPERFWRKRGQLLDSRPIKGTIARGVGVRNDRSVRRQLLESRKDRAELLMITDLVRNDLGQVADIGSVRTESLLRVRPTPSVWHLESTVSARLAPKMSWVEVMRALSPAGSISGTPKRRAVEILASLEPVKRGPYCGAIGWIDANGDADFAVGIRTLVQSGGKIRIHGGGGIVADSDPESEYYESLVKIAPLIELLNAKPSTASGSVRGNRA